MKRSGPADKIRIALDDFLDSDYFQKFMGEFRLKFAIPLTGFVLSSKRKKRVLSEGLAHLPEELGRRAHLISEMTPSIRETLARAPFQSFGIAQLLRAYLFYGQRMFEVLEDFQKKNLLEIADLYEEVRQLFNEVKGNGEIAEFYLESTAIRIHQNPIAIRIHPDASKRDLLAYIDGNWKAISDLQKRYRRKSSLIRHARKRSPSIRQRNRIIYENRLLPASRIRELLAENNIHMEDSSITKIISLERKRRKQV